MIDTSKLAPEHAIQSQKTLLQLQIALEDTFIQIARTVRLATGKKVVLLMDRGLCDGEAYVSKEAWQAIMDDMNLSIVNIRENRYDAVIHLVTAADGAEAFYSKANNQARFENAEQAR